ncbi:hypothetical protein [Dactylosporangium sp. NPDC048998]|uniref:hypothetical protein n=1 Tax=Dactylosporangium sp. NPDC048998 TaxID=3363976 RepID=UPI00371377BF
MKVHIVKDGAAEGIASGRHLAPLVVRRSGRQVTPEANVRKRPRERRPPTVLLGSGGPATRQEQPDATHPHASPGVAPAPPIRPMSAMVTYAGTVLQDQARTSAAAGVLALIVAGDTP